MKVYLVNCMRLYRRNYPFRRIMLTFFETATREAIRNKQDYFLPNNENILRRNTRNRDKGTEMAAID